MTLQEQTSHVNYGIELHHQRFAAWAASRAASVVNNRFGVERGRSILEECGFGSSFSRPELLPAPQATDQEHRRWRADVIDAAKSRNLPFTHGVAAKLVNVYLKSRFVCGGHHTHERVQNLHPPIDAVLLRTLAKLNIGGDAKGWKRAAKMGWPKFGSEDYERVVELVRHSMDGDALWKIEEHWRGNQ